MIGMGETGFSPSCSALAKKGELFVETLLTTKSFAKARQSVKSAHRAAAHHGNPLPDPGLVYEENLRRYNSGG